MKTTYILGSITKWAIASFSLLIPLQSLADIPSTPRPPEPVPIPVPVPTFQPVPLTRSEYTVHLNRDISGLLLASINFQSTTIVKLNNETGQCSTSEKTWTLGRRTLVCKNTSSCASTIPTCLMTFTSEAGLRPSDFLSILTEQPSS